MVNSNIVLGSPDFWTKVHDANKEAFSAFERIENLANEAFSEADKKAEKDYEKAVYILTRITLFGLNDVILLAGNGSGAGAMKIVRSMFESSALAEYLRLNPNEAPDYIDFGKVIEWKRYQWSLSNTPKVAQNYPPGLAKQVEDRFNQVKSRFTDSKGKIRRDWTSKSISEIAKAIGRTKEYELV
jgi:hypothetical protein